MWLRTRFLQSTWQPCECAHLGASALLKIFLRDSTSEEPSVGELRFIARLRKGVLPNCPTPAETGGVVIEGADVFLVDGQTRSKCKSLFCRFPTFRTHPPPVYSSKQFIGDQVHGVSGSGIGMSVPSPRNVTPADSFPAKLRG
jgi:rhamnogalacturonan endolyase